MIDGQEMGQVLRFVGERWIRIAGEPDSRIMKTLPSNFWMNSVGGSAGKGRWVTMLMYTESQEDADAFKEVLLRWQAKGMQDTKSPDLINITKKQKQ